MMPPPFRAYLGRCMMGAILRPGRPGVNHLAMEAVPMLMRRALTTVTALPLALGLVAEPAQAQKKTLVVALNQDPDILDPSPSRTYVGRIIFAQMCEKLYEIDENLRIFPQLAADMPTIGDGGKTVTIKLRPGVKFNDGTAMTAESVRYSLDRHLNMKGSNRRSELESVNSIDVVDALTVRLRLKTPFSPLVAILADRSGMPVSPTAANQHGKRPAPAGDLGTPLANEPRVREALDLAIDRVALNQVAWDGQYTPGCTPISPVSPFHDKSRKCPVRDVAKAKKLLAEAGLPNGYSFEMVIINDPQQRRAGEVIQGMVKEAGFNISLKPSEFASALNDNDAGKDQAFLIGWSGRVDPDANIFQFHTCGATLNTTQSCDEGVDAILNRAREVSDVTQRISLYRQAVDKFAFARRNILYLYHANYIVSHPKSLKGYKAVPDGLIRIKGVSWQ